MEAAPMADVVEIASGSVLYEADEHAWIDQQIAALRAGHLDRLDRANLIEFLTAMALRDERELRSRLVVLYSHILKVLVQPEKFGRSWRLTVLEQQRAIRAILESLPSLKRRADDILREVYPDAVRAASVETGVDRKSIPPQPLLDIEAILDYDPDRSDSG
jgi:hypothetical protein